jgi:predicted transcriptional regulator
MVYDGVMAMTLRLDDDLDTQVERLAVAQGISKQQLLVRATREYVQREGRIARTVANADRIVAENTGLLDRLGQ